MTPCTCEFEAEVLAAVAQERWPERAGAELRAHVAGCAICSDVVEIGRAIEASRAEMSAAPVVPDSGRVWWLAQRRARFEAAQAANRPLTAAQGIAAICALVALVAYFRGPSAWFQSALGRITSGLGNFDAGAWLASATRLLVEHGALALAMAAVLFLLPAAVYFAIGRD